MSELSIRALLNKLSRNLAVLKETISLENGVGNFSANGLSETAIMKIYNIAAGLELTNANLIVKNYPGVDGIDDMNKVMVQVTSTCTNEKIEHTINEVLDKKLYEKYPRLIFIFLKDKKALSKQFQAKIDKKIGGRFQFNPESDTIDLKDIYNTHYYTQDIEKIHKTVKILEETYDSGGAIAGYDAFSVCFHDEEIENVFHLVDAIIKQGINVYISSKLLHTKFIEENHPLQDFIIYSPQFASLDHINFSISVLSNSFVYQIIEQRYTCPLFIHAISNDIKMDIMSFDHSLKDLNKTLNPKIRSYRTVNIANLSKTVKNILSDRLKALALVNISAEEIMKELISTHSSFTPEVKFSESKSILLNFKMPDLGELELNYLILGNKSSHSAIGQKISSLPSQPKNLNVLVPKDFDQKTRRRLDAIRKAFNTERVYYVDEHLYDKKFKNFPKQSILNTDEFVSPVIMLNDEHLRINSIIHWIFNNSDSSVAIITGAGGIGKTTICEKIHDTIVTDNERIIVIFIDASKYIEVFRRQSYSGGTEYDIYNIFSECHPHAKLIDKNSFYLNYSLGNLIVIFDGIDEIISTIPSFNLHIFLENLENLRSKMGNGKILINCRDTYVSDLKKYYADISHLQIYELLGFSDDLAKLFFTMNFHDESSVKSCLKLIKEFYPDSDGLVYKYPPFILQVVNQIVESNFVYDEINMDFDSNILQKDDNFDIVIYRICAREYAKKGRQGFQLDIDDQIRFLCEMAIEEKGTIEQIDFERLLENIKQRDRTEDVAKGLIDHPLIQNVNSHYIFRFEFFNVYFKSVAIFNMLCTDIPVRLTERLINILAIDCNFNSVLSKVTIQKAENSKISFMSCLKYSKKVITRIADFDLDKNSANQLRKRKAISNILVIILTSKYHEYTNEYIIDFIFGHETNQIKNFYFIDVPHFANISFNFSDRYFTHTEIVNYGSFFNCIFNNETLFDETCYISNVYSNKINLKNISAGIENFDKNIKGDNSIFRVMTIKSNENEVKRFFRGYFYSFYTGRALQSELPLTSIIVPKDDKITSKVLTEILLNRGIVLKTESGKVSLDIKFKSKIIHFLNEGLLFPQLNHSISDLKNKLLSGSLEELV